MSKTHVSEIYGILQTYIFHWNIFPSRGGQKFLEQNDSIIYARCAAVTWFYVTTLRAKNVES